MNLSQRDEANFFNGKCPHGSRQTNIMNECKTSQERYEMLRGKLYLIPTGVADHPWSEGGSIKCLLLSYEGQLDFPCIIKIFFFWAVDQNNTTKSDEFNPTRARACGYRETKHPQIKIIIHSVFSTLSYFTFAPKTIFFENLPGTISPSHNS